MKVRQNFNSMRIFIVKKVGTSDKGFCRKKVVVCFIKLCAMTASVLLFKSALIVCCIN